MPTEAPLACTLSAVDLPARLVTIRELGQQALVGLEVGDRRALLRFHGEPARVDALVAAESQCCAFLQFAMTRHDEDTELEIRTPEGGEPLLRAMVAAFVAGWEAELG